MKFLEEMSKFQVIYTMAMNTPFVKDVLMCKWSHEPSVEIIGFTILKP